jgi:hypothetical protein
MRAKLSEYLNEQTESAKRLICESSTEIIEYPIGRYTITPSQKLIEVLVEIGQTLVQMEGGSTYDIPPNITYLTGLEYVFKNRTRTVGNVRYEYKATILNSSTFYTELWVDKSELSDKEKCESVEYMED